MTTRSLTEQVFLNHFNVNLPVLAFRNGQDC